MRRVDRRLSPCPLTWRMQVQRALPDHPTFLREAAKFERLGINSDVRRLGFATYAPHVLLKRKSGRAEFPATWGRHKEVIATMSYRKCVYCEAPITAPRAAHIEHFKPKALFPAQAYEWTNFFLGCPGCNGAKSDKWPKRNGYIRPDRGDPSKQFVFRNDGTVRAAKPGSVADRMLDDLDLKREWLSQERKLNITEMLRLLDSAVRFQRGGNTPQAKILAATILRNISSPERAYSAALMQCFWRAWKNACPRVKL